MSNRQYICATVISTKQLSTNMRRIVLQSEALEHFPQVAPGAYIKLLFDANGQALTSLPSAARDVMMRTYTVRALDRIKQQLSIDFVMHTGEGAHGPACDWASQAKTGDSICFAGPGSSKPLNENYDWVLFAGDMTALPSIENYLETLAADTKGYAVLAVNEPSDIRELVKPEQLELVWLTQPDQSLAQAISQLPKLPGKPAIWAASEFSQMRQMRQLFSNEWNIARNDYYISSYWKQGRSEEQHKIDKRQDQLELEAQA